MRKYIGIQIIILLLACFLLTQVSLAEEKAGFVKSSWRKLFNIFKKPEPEPTAKPKPTEKNEPQTEPQPTEPQSTQPQPEPKKHPMAEMPKEEIIERIKHMLEISPEALDFIPELKVETDKDGNVIVVKYKVSGVFEDISGLEKEDLIKIHNRVNNERVRIQTERIQHQLEAVRASQNIPKPPPQVYIPQAPPAPPKQPPAPPRVQTPPPPPPPQPRR